MLMEYCDSVKKIVIIKLTKFNILLNNLIFFLIVYSEIRITKSYGNPFRTLEATSHTW